jgi:hypothetical protein
VGRSAPIWVLMGHVGGAEQRSNLEAQLHTITHGGPGITEHDGVLNDQPRQLRGPRLREVQVLGDVGAMEGREIQGVVEAGMGKRLNR